MLEQQVFYCSDARQGLFSLFAIDEPVNGNVAIEKQ